MAITYKLNTLNGSSLYKSYDPTSGNSKLTDEKNNIYYYETSEYSSNGVEKSPLLLNFGDGYEYPQEKWDRFNRWYSVNPDDEAPPSRHYIFFLRPDCYLLNSAGTALSSDSRVNEDSTFIYLYNNHPEIIESLTGEFRTGLDTKTTTKSKSTARSASGYGNAIFTDSTTDKNGASLAMHALLPFLTGRVESMQLPDYVVKSYTLTQPYTKYSLPVGVNAIESSTGGTFDVTFREDKDLNITKLFYAWAYYIDGVSRNVFSPKKKYLLYNALDYATSVYDIAVGPTGEDIVYFGKYTGVIPTNVPISDLSWSKGGTPQTTMSVSFSYFMYESFNSDILVDFNYNSLGYIYMNESGGSPDMYSIATYNPEEVTSGVAMVGRPFIITENGKPLLKWAPPTSGIAVQTTDTDDSTKTVTLSDIKKAVSTASTLTKTVLTSLSKLFR